ncbi:Putative lipopolysaccharide biosynthesis protein [Erwinia amylovora Ea644]|uniref:O-antigen ligase family protein n=1 Tax=Erwinia amylovora TaxID=552 RepID=UPI0002CBAD71|nr:O-antigen ligase family protein [Erwinia amylovora]CCP01196.1 Putative lipopolysaccharide biosynthesis protein [Erwinia amylovora Ea644]
MIFDRTDTRFAHALLLFYSAFIFFLPIFGGVVRVSNLFHIASTLMLIAVLFRKSIRDIVFQQRLFNRGLCLVTLMLVWFTLSNLWGDNPANIGSTLKHSFYLLAFLTLFHFASQQKKKTMLIAAIFSGIVILCILVFYFADKQYLFTNRLEKAFFGEPDNVIDLGGYYAIGILCGLILLRETGSKWLYLPITLLFIGLLFTQSRGPLFSLLLACLPLLLLIRRIHFVHLLISLSIIIAIGLVIALTDYDHTLAARIGASYQQSFTRFGIWWDALSMIQQNPLVGWGFNQQLNFVNDVGQRVHTTHCLYLATLLKGGIAGMLLLLSIIGYGLYMGWQQVKQGCTLEAVMFVFSLLFYTTQGMFIISNPGESWLLFWLPLAIVMTLPKRSEG